MKIAVLGSGGWGTALPLLLLENGHKVLLWSSHARKADLLRQSRKNPMLEGVMLPENLIFTSEMAKVGQADMVVCAVPSFAVRETARMLAAVIAPGAVVVSVSKGFEKESALRLSQVIAQEMNNPVAVLCGPSHAEEVARRIPTACVAASGSRELAELVQDTFMNRNFRVYTSSDVVGVELAAALKNIIALCCGICDGMGYGDNTKAMLMTRGLVEISRLGVVLGGKKETFGGLAGVGDLIVTCTSMHSRNRRAGILIGQGIPVMEAMSQINAVVEGYYAAQNAWHLAKRAGVEMPISDAAYQVLYHGKDVHTAIQELMNRSKKHETEETWI
ncbi:MAG: NAD(P)-dependent glycerol-3-phosphate dehydrogenase [Oscillospiraceae bacterium]|nr:NAD(P)-dependent glycerol-3-phosphate dehydrogenase [Oscillospiraceae bacterium]